MLEGMPKAVLEGMACGLPPVLFDSYGPDFVTDGEDGFVVKTEAEMFKALECLAANPQLRATMGAKARMKAQQYDWEHVSALWREIFESARCTLGAGGREL
jgi:glycosyltransferase involved in cell wall biosynthesis